MNDYEQAISKLQKALELKRIIYPEKAAPEVGLAFRLLATAFLRLQKYEKALSCFQEALRIFEVNQSADDEMECVLNIALCYKGLKNRDYALENFGKVEEMCVRKSVSDRMRQDIHETMADIFTEEEYGDKSKVLHHLKEAATILKRIKLSENDEEALNELEAKILSLDIT